MIFKMEFTMADPRTVDEDPQAAFFGAIREAFNRGESITVQTGEALLTGHGRGLADAIEGGTVSFTVEMEVTGFGVVSAEDGPQQEDDYDRLRRIEKELPNVIDGSWRHSWHWHRGQTGRLTEEGWRQALKDAKNQMRCCEERANELERTVDDVQWVLSRFYGEEDEDA